MTHKDAILWEGIPIETLSREKLYEVIRQLMIEQKYWISRITTQRHI